MLLFCLVSTSLSAPCPLKDHVALAILSFINGMSVPSCVVAPGEGMVHLRRGLRPLRYHVLHVRRAHLLTMRATTELPDQHATLE